MNPVWIILFAPLCAAAEVAVGLAILVALFRRKQTVNVNELNSMRL